jgi:hypothetical protein
MIQLKKSGHNLTKEKAMQVTVTFSRPEIMSLIEGKMFETFPNLDRVILDFAEQVPEAISIKIELKEGKDAPKGS